MTARRRKAAPRPRKPRGPGFFTVLVVGLVKLVGATARQVRKEARAMNGQGEPRPRPRRGGVPKPRTPGRPRVPQPRGGAGNATPGREHPGNRRDWNGPDRDPFEQPEWQRQGFPSPEAFEEQCQAWDAERAAEADEAYGEPEAAPEAGDEGNVTDGGDLV